MASFFFFAATAVRIFRGRTYPDVFAPLWSVWKGLFGLLSGQRPLLRLGWRKLLRLYTSHQKVREPEFFETALTSLLSSQLNQDEKVLIRTL